MLVTIFCQQMGVDLEALTMHTRRSRQGRM